MNCPYCHALNQRDRQATQRLTYWKDSFGIQRKDIRDACDSHASFIRLAYHVVSTELLTIDTRKE